MVPYALTDLLGDVEMPEAEAVSDASITRRSQISGLQQFGQSLLEAANALALVVEKHGVVVLGCPIRRQDK